MAVLTTQPTGDDVQAFLQAVVPERRRSDGLFLANRMGELTGWAPRMWGESIVGFGRYHYRYESGRTGSFLVTGFAPRKTALSIYIMPGYRDLAPWLNRLGKHKTGKACLYINKLDDVDLSVLDDLIREGVRYMREHYEVDDGSG